MSGDSCGCSVIEPVEQAMGWPEKETNWHPQGGYHVGGLLRSFVQGLQELSASALIGHKYAYYAGSML